MGLSSCLEKLQRFQTAIEILEETQLISSISFKNSKRVSEHLLKIYKKLGEKEESANQMKSALTYYEKCLNACSKSSNNILEAEITMKVSDIYIKMGLFSFAQNKIEDFRNLTLNREKKIEKLDDMNYRRLLADCCLKQNMLDEAKIHAEDYFRLAEELPSDFLGLKAEAALKFADILWLRGIYPKKAITHYDLYFDFCKSNVRLYLICVDKSDVGQEPSISQPCPDMCGACQGD